MSESVPLPETVSPEPAEREPSSLWRYQMWTHLGDGAEACDGVDEHAGKVTCGDSAHFHAWLRLPNQFQQADVETAAMAAKARKARQLADQGSNAYAILEDGIAEFEDRDDRDAALEEIAGEIVSVTWWRDRIDATREAGEIPVPDWTPDEEDDDDAEAPKLYSDIEIDRLRFAEIIGTDGADPDELDELRRHLQDYEDDLDHRVEDRQRPKRQAIIDAGWDAAVVRLRRKRIATLAQAEFTATYAAHEWLACTYREPDGKPYWPNMDAMRAAPRAVLELVEATFTDLERTARSSGN